MSNNSNKECCFQKGKYNNTFTQYDKYYKNKNISTSLCIEDDVESKNVKSCIHTYVETFAPVVSHSTVCTFLAAAAHCKLNIKYIDINNTFFHGDLEKKVYMIQPGGYTMPKDENKECNFNKAIYG